MLYWSKSTKLFAVRILIEAHHPGDIHFWKFPIKELLERGHQVRLLARDRDVMRKLVEAYDWLPATIPTRSGRNNRFPLREMLSRQWLVARECHSFKPDVVASLFGSYSQAAGLLGIRNVIFTDSEFQHFNHRIAHPFASEIHTPYCFYKPLGRKQRYYKGIHELAFLDGRRYTPDCSVLEQYPNLEKGNYVVIRLSAWNTFHDIHHSGIGESVRSFIDQIKRRWPIVISAEENELPEDLKQYAFTLPPHQFHDLLAFSRFVLTEGASTASEAACLGVPAVFINSTEPRGYLQMLESQYGLVKNFQDARSGLHAASDWLRRLDDNDTRDSWSNKRKRLVDDHCDICRYVVDTLESRN